MKMFIFDHGSEAHARRRWKAEAMKMLYDRAKKRREGARTREAA
jgi:hypothetical protein